MEKTNNVANNWYDFMQPDASTSYGLCHWGAALAATSSALAALFQRLAEHQTEATREMVRVANDPSRAPQAYAAYSSRMMQMQAEMQGALEKINQDANVLYENIRRGIDDETSAPFTSPMGAPLVEPSMKYGQAASQQAAGPGDWKFDPAQRLMSYGQSNDIPPLPDVQLPMTPPAAADGNAGSPRQSSQTDLPSLATMAPQPGFARGGSAAASIAAPMIAVALPPAPAMTYPTSDAAAATSLSSVNYRCDGYRRAARAKP